MLGRLVAAGPAVPELPREKGVLCAQEGLWGTGWLGAAQVNLVHQASAPEETPGQQM